MGESRLSNDDRPLVLKIKQGNEDAFTELVDRYKGKAFGLAYHFLNNVEDAREVSQEAFLRVYCSIHRFKNDSSFYTWFYRIVINLCIDFRRKKKAMTIPFSQMNNFRDFKDGVIDQVAEDDMVDNPIKALLKQELSEQINEAIESLPKKQRTVFILKNYEKLPLKEIAVIMNCAQGTVKSHLARAVRKLRDHLKPYVIEQSRGL
jgi:RNA polymerase sigma-70 factor (ECF subfamily)